MKDCAQDPTWLVVWGMALLTIIGVGAIVIILLGFWEDHR